MKIEVALVFVVVGAVCLAYSALTRVGIRNGIVEPKHQSDAQQYLIGGTVVAIVGALLGVVAALSSF